MTDLIVVTDETIRIALTEGTFMTDLTVVTEGTLVTNLTVVTNETVRTAMT